MWVATSTACAVSALVALATACHDCPEKPDDCVENSVTLTQGIYGQVLGVDDVVHDENCTQYPLPAPGYVIWLAAADGSHVAEDTSGEMGAFELNAPAGEYPICVQSSFVNCGNMIVVPSGRARFDVMTGFLTPTFASRRGAALCGREP